MRRVETESRPVTKGRVMGPLDASVVVGIAVLVWSSYIDPQEVGLVTLPGKTATAFYLSGMSPPYQHRLDAAIYQEDM